MSEREKFKWHKPTVFDTSKVSNNDVRQVTIPVNCLFTWSTVIPDEWDDDGNVIHYTEGFIMEVMPGQKFIYNNEPTVLMYQAAPMKQKA